MPLPGSTFYGSLAGCGLRAERWLFPLEVSGFAEVFTDDASGGVVFDVGEAEGAQLSGSIVRCEVAKKRFVGACGADQHEPAGARCSSSVSAGCR